MLRLTALSRSEGEAVLTVVGWVEGKDVALLDREIGRELEGVQRLVLDLAGTRSIDQAGLDALKRWSTKGLVLRGGSAFVRALLEAHRLEMEEVR